MIRFFRQSAARAAVLLLLFSIFAGPSSAFEVSPMRAELAPTGSGASTVITVRNTLAEPLAIEVYATDRIVAENGEQSFEPNDDDFLLFPPQAFIQPGASQAFRVQYIGEPALNASRSYVVNVSQVPIKQVEGAGVQVVYRFGAAIYVNPKGASSALSIEETSASNGSVAVKIRNEGNRVAFLSNDRLVLSTPSGTTTLEGNELRTRVANPILPPLSTRLFTFDAPEVRSGSQVSATLFPRDD